ncbi:hypothetical protein PFISCL1PPCAC_3025, partial [Pristionchus fissidentatus]
GDEEEEEREKEKEGMKRGGSKGKVMIKEEKEKNLSIAEMIERACSPEKGQKAMVKRLLADRDVLFRNAKVNELRRILWTTSIMTTPEGQKLGTLVFMYLGMMPAMHLIKKRVVQDDFRASDCKNYGNMLLSVYRTAEARDRKDGNWDGSIGPRTQDVCDAFTYIAEAAILVISHIGEKFNGILMASIEMADRSKYDGLIYRAFEPVLWQYLRANNDQVRYNASLLLLRFFPVVERGNMDNVVTLDDQYAYMQAMLTDDCVEIRKEAAKRVIRIVANFYSLIPYRFTREMLVTIVDKLSYDSVPIVRQAVLEGLPQLFPVSAALNVTEQCLLDTVPHLFEDKNEKVRLAAARALNALKPHRFIKYHTIIPMDDVMARLECETSDVVRRELVKMVIFSFFPSNANADELVLRTAKLVTFGRNAALAVHRLIVQLELYTLDDAVAHIKNLAVVVYKNWRKGVPESDELASLEGDTGDVSLFNTSALSNTSIADASALAIPTLDGEREAIFQRDKNIMECAVVLWASIAKDLKKPGNEKLKVICDKLMAKIFKKLFASFRQTSLLGTVMCVGSLLPSSLLEEYSIQVLALLKEKTVEEEILEPYLEAGASWRIADLIKIVKKGLAELPAMLPELFHSKSASSTSTASPSRKKARPNNRLSPVERIRQALHYLRYSLKSESITAKMMNECKLQLEECFEALSQVHGVIDSYLDSMDDDGEELKLLTPQDVLSLYDSAAVLAILMMELPTTSSASTERVTRSGRKSLSPAPEDGTEEKEKEDGEEEEEDPYATSSSPYSLFFFASIHWMEQSLLPRIARLPSIDRDKEQLQLKLAKTSLDHMETILTSCARPPLPPTAAAMMEMMKKGMGGGGGESSADEGEENDEGRMRRLSMVSTTSTVVSSAGTAPDPPQKSYLERVHAVLKACLHHGTPLPLLKSILKLDEHLMNVESEEGEEARGLGASTVWSAFSMIGRAVENPYNGEELRQQTYGDAIMTFAKAAIAKCPAGPSKFPYGPLVANLRSRMQRCMQREYLERGLEDPTEHTYELNPFIEFALNRFIFRSDKWYNTFRAHAAHLPLDCTPQKMERGDDREEGGETVRERKERENTSGYERFIIGCQLLRLSAPARRREVVK